MATQTQMNVLREKVYDEVQGQLSIQNIDFEGRGTEGLIYYDPAIDAYFVAKVIVKKEGFDPTDDLEAYAERVVKVEEKAKTKAEKVAKAKAKKEEEGD